MGLLGVALLALTSCSGQAKDKAGVKGPPAVPVMAMAAVQKDVPVYIKAIGSVEPSQTVAVGARVGGALTRVAFVEGKDVRAGDLLFTIDPRPYKAGLEEAEANLARDRARAASAEADVARYTDLVQKDYVTKQQFDEVTSNAEALKATVKADEAQVASARLNLDYCSIRAPISGRTGNLLVHEGNLIKANDSNPMVVINQIAPVQVSFSVPEQRLAEIRRYAAEGKLRVEASVPSDTAAAVLGELTLIDNAVDPGTGTIFLKATFPNADQALWPGQFVSVSLLLTTLTGAVVIPADAVQTGQQGDYVFVIKSDMTVDMRPVTQGARLDSDVVVERGVAAGEQIVTDGQLRLVPGSKVSLRTSLVPAARAGEPGAPAGGPSTPAGPAGPAGTTGQTGQPGR